MRVPTLTYAIAVLLSMALHAMVFLLASACPFACSTHVKELPKEQIFFAEVLPPAPDEAPVTREKQPAPTASLPVQAPAISQETDPVAKTAGTAKRPASMAAPPPPTAEEWAFAAKYTQKNSKGYRYSWGQQVRSMMGAAVEGPDQGFVRFRVEIAPDGTLAKLDTLWTTSLAAEQLARKAIKSMPPLPPTPTGNPLIFEKTISFTPYASDGPPSYKDDCLPDPPVFRNPFAWDGKSPQVRVEIPRIEQYDPKAMEECLRQLPKDSIEAEMARDQREMERWGWSK